MSDAASPQNGVRRADEEPVSTTDETAAATAPDDDANADEATAGGVDAVPAASSAGGVADAPADVDADDPDAAEAARRAEPQWTQEAPRVVAEPTTAQETTEAPRVPSSAAQPTAPSSEPGPVPASPAAPQLVEPEEPPATTGIPVAELLADSRDAESVASAPPAAAPTATAAPVAEPAPAAEPIIPVPAAERPRAVDEQVTTGSTTYPTGAQPLPAVDHEAFSSFLATDDVEPPKAQHNRLFGAGFALLSSIVFGALYGGIVAGILALRERAADWLPTFLDFVTGQTFVIPVVAYAVLALIFALLLNRAHWFAHVVTSLVLGALVYAVAIVTTLLLAGVTSLDSAASRNLLVEQIENPWFIVAGLAARETAMWFGFIAAARGRKVVARNREARERFDRDQAEKKAQRERGYVAV
ncbi:hypothetical protein [Schumannella soli]|uniref:Uncharacterized protein n=1 Tax=Schumannella soli TaxID=2590779 RepID=A0A506XYV5_9MICO|nr:hypothetical protein [Schumannella soli]TPW74783.1 hypothetical protein FJ657_14515 [Schumannella soli]